MAEATPAGGDESRAVWYDEYGEETADPSAAASGEVTEYRDGEAIARTYVGAPPGEPPAGPTGYRVDAEDQDAAKATWDVRGPDGAVAADLAGLRAAVLPGSTDREWAAWLAAFAGAPAFAAAPRALRDEAAAALGAGAAR